MKPVEKILCEAQERGFLPVESEHKGTRFVFDKEAQAVAILTCGYNRPRRGVVIPLYVVRELAEAMEVLC